MELIPAGGFAEAQVETYFQDCCLMLARRLVLGFFFEHLFNRLRQQPRDRRLALHSQHLYLAENRLEQGKGYVLCIEIASTKLSVARKFE